MLEYGRWADWQVLVAHYGKTPSRRIGHRLPQSPATSIRILLRLVSTPTILLPMLRFDAIPESVRKLLTCLAEHEVLRGFVLGGGTSIRPPLIGGSGFLYRWRVFARSPV